MNKDIIYRHAAIDAIKTWGLLDGLSEGQAIEILADEEKLPSAQPESKREWYMKGYRDGQPRWIPCSERNPDKDGRYLITGKMGTVYSLDLEDGRWYGGIKPIAWCVLPEPWQGGQE